MNKEQSQAYRDKLLANALKSGTEQSKIIPGLWSVAFNEENKKWTVYVERGGNIFIPGMVVIAECDNEAHACLIASMAPKSNRVVDLVPEFFKQEKLVKWFEYESCRERENGTIEVCPNTECEFWSVYARVDYKGLYHAECVANLATEEQANQLTELLNQVNRTEGLGMH